MAAARAVGGSSSARSSSARSRETHREEAAKEATSPAAKARALSAVTATAQGAARDALETTSRSTAGDGALIARRVNAPRAPRAHPHGPGLAAVMHSWQPPALRGVERKCAPEFSKNHEA